MYARATHISSPSTNCVVERFLYRLGRSEYHDRFLLKGAMLFLVWKGELHRMTRDLDLLGFGESSAPELERVVRAVCAVDVPEDGMTFAAKRNASSGDSFPFVQYIALFTNGKQS